MKIFIHPYRTGSNSVAALSQAIGAKVIRLENSRFTGGDNKFVVNWGNSVKKEKIEKCFTLNDPDVVKMVSNKKDFFEKVSGVVTIPEFTTKIIPD